MDAKYNNLRKRGNSLPRALPQAYSKMNDQYSYEFRPKRTYSVSGGLTWDYTVTGDGDN